MRVHRGVGAVVPISVLTLPVDDALTRVKGLAFPIPGRADTSRQTAYQSSVATMVMSLQVSDPEARALVFDAILRVGVSGLEAVFMTLLTDPQFSFPSRWDEAMAAWSGGPSADMGAVFSDLTTGNGGLLSPATVQSLKPATPRKGVLTGPDPHHRVPDDIPQVPTGGGGGGANAHLVQPGQGLLAANLTSVSTAQLTGIGSVSPMVNPSIWSTATWLKALAVVAAVANGATTIIAAGAAMPLLAVVGPAAVAAGAIIAFEDGAYSDAQVVVVPPSVPDPPTEVITVYSGYTGNDLVCTNPDQGAQGGGSIDDEFAHAPEMLPAE